MPNIHLTHVTIAFAFETLGGRVFGDRWTGLEIQYWRLRPEPPEDVEAKRRRLTAQCAKFDAQRRKLLDIADNASGLPYADACRAAYEAANASYLAASKELNAIANTEPKEGNYALFCAYNETWEQLRKALASGRLEAVISRGTSIQSIFWESKTFGRFDLENSLGYFRKPACDVKRALVMTRREPFLNWLITIPPADKSAEFDVHGWCRERFAIERARRAKPMKARLFETIRNELRELGHEDALSRYLFDSLWAHDAPEEWKRKGRVPAPKPASS